MGFTRVLGYTSNDVVAVNTRAESYVLRLGRHDESSATACSLLLRARGESVVDSNVLTGGVCSVAIYPATITYYIVYVVVPPEMHKPWRRWLDELPAPSPPAERENGAAANPPLHRRTQRC